MGDSRRPGIGRVIRSVLAAMFGVQSERRRSEDFASASPVPYVIAGLVMTAVFVVIIWVVVQLVLAGAS